MISIASSETSYEDNAEHNDKTLKLNIVSPGWLREAKKNYHHIPQHTVNHRG
jgi:hypothetical protein